MKNRILKQTEREYSPKQRFVAVLVEGIAFMVILPLVLVVLASLFDQWLRLPRIAFAPIDLLIGWLLIVAGWLFAMWSIYAQFTLGRGTPAPIMATQKLVVQAPYTYCRNPMALGTIVYFLGIAILQGSLSAVVLALLGTALLLTYIKRIEEKELEARFGQEYRDYKQRTPFLIPHP